MEYLGVAFLGVLVGIGELVARYRDAPAKALLSLPAGLYLILNAIASLTALALVDAFGWEFGLPDSAAGAKRWIQVLAAGLGAMALFRSSLFNIRVGDQDIGVGPAGFLQVVLAAVDRAVDRGRAEPRALDASKIMEGVAFSKAHVALPTLCFALMQNVTAEEQQKFGHQLQALESSDMDDAIKKLCLGLALMNLVGSSVLKAAVKALGSHIRDDD